MSFCCVYSEESTQNASKHNKQNRTFLIGKGCSSTLKQIRIILLNDNYVTKSKYEPNTRRDT